MRVYKYKMNIINNNLISPFFLADILLQTSKIVNKIQFFQDLIFLLLENRVTAEF
jgi:hypothetical protein